MPCKEKSIYEEISIIHETLLETTEGAFAVKILADHIQRKRVRGRESLKLAHYVADVDK